MRNTFYYIIFLTVVLSSCGKVKQLEEQNTLLLAHLKNSEGKYNALEEYVEGYTDMINSVQEELNAIEDGNKYLVKYDDLGNPVMVEKNKDTLLEHIAQLKEKLEENKELLGQLDIANDKIKKLEQTVINLQKELDRKEEIIREMKGTIFSYEELIKSLKSNVNQLNREVKNLQTQNKNLQNKTQSLNQTIVENKLKRYCFIVSRKDEPDIFEVTDEYEINFSNSYPKVLSSHASSSYSLNKNRRKDWTLEITDYNRFWENTQFLVIRVNR